MASAGRSGDVVARLDGAVVERGSFTLGPIDLRRSRPASGSPSSVPTARARRRCSTPCSAAASSPPAGGTLGPSVVVGEVEQARDRLDAAPSLLRAFQDEHRAWTPADVRTLLAKFGLVADHVTRPTATLSPGERTRASLALLMANGANVLVLDEPTNHLDLPAIEQLEAALDRFDGTVLLVTHDRSLLERVRLTRRIELAAGRIVADDRL